MCRSDYDTIKSPSDATMSNKDNYDPIKSNNSTATGNMSDKDELRRRSSKKKKYFLIYYAALFSMVIFYSIRDSKARQSPFHNATWNFATWNLMAVAVFGFVGDLPVLRWHSGNPVHAKFKLNPWRSFSLALHVAAGLTEIFAQFAAFFSAPPHTRYWSYLACAVALLGHIPTSTYQAPNVFGVKSFTLPFYYIFIYMHIHATLHLIQDPTSPQAILKQFIALHGYAWVRIALFWFRQTNTVQAYSYTAAIWFAGFLTCPPVLGEAANFYFVVAMIGFQALLAISHYLPPKFLHTLLGFGPAGITPMCQIEFSRHGLGVLPQSLIRAAVEMELMLEDRHPIEPGDATGLLDRQKTEKRRNSLQQNVGFAFAGPPRLSRFGSTDSFVPTPPMLERTSSYLDDTSAGFGTSTRRGDLMLNERRLDALDYNTSQIVALMDDVFGRAHELTKKERARLAFHMFAGSNGEINLKVFAAVLTYWTVPISDIQNLMNKYGNEDGCIDLPTWTAHLDVVYDYVIYTLCTNKSLAYFESRRQNLGTDKCPVHAIKDALAVPNAILLEV